MKRATTTMMTRMMMTRNRFADFLDDVHTEVPLVETRLSHQAFCECIFWLDCASAGCVAGLRWCASECHTFGGGVHSASARERRPSLSLLEDIAATKTACGGARRSVCINYQLSPHSTTSISNHSSVLLFQCQIWNTRLPSFDDLARLKIF